MQLSNIFLAVLAATTVSAAPAPVVDAVEATTAHEIEARQNSKEIRVILQNQSIELGGQTAFTDNGKRQTRNFSSGFGPIQTVELKLGKSVKSTFRCQITDTKGNPITVKRGANTATTFADGGKGAWTLAKTVKVGSIICDPKF
ncbi:hypothetical protein QBC34DRAFT_499426 [Podospora aff. communis PSN243]|uniref:Uncharacterized protein n=1 Tax=Podospora aff. communis PSN243 TaxID=3040156 RepID=A0AAV9G458_9PEZI|nr:hypothetical protein QBC34DRAFT_499426 [Podospora aff. communis PSN243]